MTYLKPCPFCGSDASVLKNGEFILVGCYHPVCGVRPEVVAGIEKTATDLWNRRVEFFDMDGSFHIVGDRGCCGTGYVCHNDLPKGACGGIVHYQAVYGGYYYECDLCHTTDEWNWLNE